MVYSVECSWYVKKDHDDSFVIIKGAEEIILTLRRAVSVLWWRLYEDWIGSLR